MYSGNDDRINAAGFPHSDISGYHACFQLTRAFRRIPRPSSPLTAKASTVCASLLDHITSIHSKLYNAIPIRLCLLNFYHFFNELPLAQRTILSLENIPLCISYDYLRLHWWSQGGSNSRPPACKAGALPAEL